MCQYSMCALLEEAQEMSLCPVSDVSEMLPVWVPSGFGGQSSVASFAHTLVVASSVLSWRW